MSWDPLGNGTHPVFRPVDNSGVVRQVDPRTTRDLWSLVLLVGTLVAALVFYAWPHFEARQTALTAERAQREREQLLEQNRKLRLEKAALEDLRRVETIATRDLKMGAPEAQHIVVVEVSEKPATVRRAAVQHESGRVEN